MAAQTQQLHFILFPLMAQGHMIPVIDIAKLLAQRGVTVTIVTTPHNANRFRAIVARAIESGLSIRFLELRFPCEEAGLPEGCENLDLLPSVDWASKFFVATSMLQQPLEEELGEMEPKPSCIISDMGFPWTSELASKFHIPRIVFHGTCCFSLLCSHNLKLYNVLDNLKSESEPFVVPGLPDPIELTKAQLPGFNTPSSSPFKRVSDQIKEAEKAAYGVVVNTFEELEKEYVKEFKKAKGGKVWCIGPVSLCNKEVSDKAERGKKPSIEGTHCLDWLDLQDPGSVVYVCLGSLSRLTASQMIEIGLGLEESNRPFIWVVKETSDELEKWISEEGFGERTKDRGLLIRGWAPQVLILSHPAIGIFFTHCGWNSTLEGVCAGVPMMTWPMFAEQFCNEKLVVQVLRIGVSVGGGVPMMWGEENKVGVLVKKDVVKEGIDDLLDGGEEGEVRRERARKLGDMARRAVEEGGSSHLNMTLLIQDIREKVNCEQ
ncbi:UDP-glycosyltransferase 73C6-like [Rhododendron vialii]|uniref:UDP-glycosyltransferase 73C6-like n=1 Tax=Rhododendron vialii TaxID=182163 RepID=UPI00265D8EF2|nr:UDP-glycosyltransferase 73C6-like [Rhododendron vialii]